MEFLLLQIKRNNQVLVRPGIAYAKDLSSLKTKVGEWLDEEVYFLERKQQLYLMAERPLHQRVPVSSKIKVDLSVAQVAYVLKLLIESNVILSKNVSEIIRHLTRALKTKRSETISDESFRLKYYNVETSTKEYIKRLFLKLSQDS